MEKGLKIVFWTMFGLLFFFFFYLTIVMYLSPRQDARERGFIPCTKRLVTALQDCPAGKLGCPFKLLIKDMACNIGVVGTGAANWAKGKQPTPWANYLFEPEPYADDDAAASDAEFKQKMKQSMEDLEQQSRFIEKKLRELEEAKHRQLNILPSELQQNPAQKPIMEEVAETVTEAEADLTEDDISAESDIRLEKTTSEGKDVEIPHNEVDILKKIHEITNEKLQKGNLKDEK